MASPVATLLNPLKADQILIFFLTQSAQLGLERKLLSGSGPAYVDKGTVQGVIKNPGSMAVCLRANMVTVYGITAQKGAPAGSPNVISQLSPIYNPIAIGKPSFTMFPGLATTNEQANRSRVYYLQGDLAAPKIVEYSLTNNDAGNLSVLPQTFPHPNTSIAACNRAQSRLIAYQALESNNSLFSYDTDQEASTRIQNTDGLPPGTPLAMVAVLENIYLYYGSSGRYLTKVALTKDGWQKPFQVPGSIHLAQGTCLSVTNSGTINYVVYQQDGGDGFNIVEDTLDTREP